MGLKSEVARDDDAGIDHPDGVSTRTAYHLPTSHPPDLWLSRFSTPSSGGKCIGFVVNRTLWKVSLRGGAPVRLAGAPNVFYGAAWGDAERTSGHLIYRQGGALLLHRVDDRTFEPVGKLISVVPAGTRDELVASFAATPKGNRG